MAGNHDVDRAKVSRRHKPLYCFRNQQEITDTLAEPGLRGLILGKFDEFNDFAEQLMGRCHYNEDTYHLTEQLDLQKGGAVAVGQSVGAELGPVCRV